MVLKLEGLQLRSEGDEPVAFCVRSWTVQYLAGNVTAFFEYAKKCSSHHPLLGGQGDDVSILTASINHITVPFIPRKP